MKKLIALALTAALAAMLLAGCGGSDAPDEGTAGDGTAADNMTVEPADDAAAPEDTGDAAADTGDAAGSAEAADTAKVEAIVAAVEAVNEVPNPLPYDDFSMDHKLHLTMDNIVAYKGDATNNGDDCALVLAIQAKDGTADAVAAELQSDLDQRISVYEGYSDDYAEPLLKAQDARIVVEGNFVVYVIAGVNGPDYADIDTAISTALAQ